MGAGAERRKGSAATCTAVTDATQAPSCNGCTTGGTGSSCKAQQGDTYLRRWNAPTPIPLGGRVHRKGGAGLAIGTSEVMDLVAFCGSVPPDSGGAEGAAGRWGGGGVSVPLVTTATSGLRRPPVSERSLRG